MPISTAGRYWWCFPATIARTSCTSSIRSPPSPTTRSERGFEFPYLYDETQQVAAAYHAACTPDFFLFDADHRLAYRGQYDGSRPNNGVAVDGRDLKAAVAAVLAGGAVDAAQVASMGCNIKWRAGNEPDYG